MSRLITTLLILAGQAACASDREQATGDRPLTPSLARRTAWLGSRLNETSGLAASRAWPGILWTHNDSGDDAVIFATDTTGADRGRFTLMGAENRDWEDLALGPCPQGTCLYVGETGDNPGTNPTAVIYRFPEPNPATPGVVRGVERLVFRYPDRPRNVEAMFVAPDTSVHLISKGTPAETRHYRLAAPAWSSGDTAMAERMSMPALEGGGRHPVTGATIGPDGITVVLLTYGDTWRLALLPDGSLAPMPPFEPCDLGGLLPQAEAVTWLGADSTLLLSSEASHGKRAQFMVVRCPWGQ